MFLWLFRLFDFFLHRSGNDKFFSQNKYSGFLTASFFTDLQQKDFCIYFLNRLLDGQALEWAWTIYLPKNLVNGNEAHSLDKSSSEWIDRQTYEPTHWLDKLSSK